MTDAVIITGCSGGIGRALVQEFSEAGLYTIGIDRITSEVAPSHFIQTDLRDIALESAAGLKLAEQLRNALGRRCLTTLVNNAAVQNVAAIEELSLDQIRESFDVNVIAPFVLSQLCLDDLKAASGTILNVGSIHSRLTKPGFTAYATSKGALHNLTSSLAVEVGNTVRVNAIMPAAIETAMLIEGFGGSSMALESLKSHHPVRKLGDPLEVARLAVAMATMELPFLNGSIVDLSGGISSRLHDPE